MWLGVGSAVILVLLITFVYVNSLVLEHLGERLLNALDLGEHAVGVDARGGRLPAKALTEAESVKSVDCIIATCNNDDEIEETKALVRQVYGQDVRFFVYEKCQEAPMAREGQEKTFLRNTGREQHTYTLHIQNHYDDLAEILIFTPSNINSRKTRYDLLRNRVTGDAQCIRGKEFKTLHNFTHPNYQGRPLDRATPVGIETWARAHIGRYPAPSTRECKHGTFVTTRELVQRHTRHMFSRLTEELDRAEPEAGHYMERLVAVLYEVE